MKHYIVYTISILPFNTSQTFVFHRHNHSVSSSPLSDHHDLGLYFSFQILYARQPHPSNHSRTAALPLVQQAGRAAILFLLFFAQQQSYEWPCKLQSCARRNAGSAVQLQTLKGEEGALQTQKRRTYHEFPTRFCPFSSARRRYCAALNCPGQLCQRDVPGGRVVRRAAGRLSVQCCPIDRAVMQP